MRMLSDPEPEQGAAVLPEPQVGQAPRGQSDYIAT